MKPRVMSTVVTVGILCLIGFLRGANGLGPTAALSSPSAPGFFPLAADVPGRATGPWAFLRMGSSPLETGPLWVPFVRDGDLWAVDARGGGERQLSTLGHAFGPLPSSDGEHVAYLVAAQPDGAGVSTAAEIHVVPVAGGEDVPITSGPGSVSMPAWSPDGGRLAFVQDRQLVVVDLLDMSRTVLAENVGSDGPGLPSPAWSPDGESLVCVLEQGGRSSLWSIRTSDGAQQDLGTSEYHDAPYGFAPGLGMVYVQPDGHGGGDLLIAAGQESGVLLTDVVDFAWSLDGRSLAVRRSDRSLWIGGPRGEDRVKLSDEAEILYWLGDDSLAYRTPRGLYRFDPASRSTQLLVEWDLPVGGDIHAQNVVTGTLDTPWRTQFEGICGGTNCGPASLGITMDYLGVHHSNDMVRRAINVYLRGGETSCGSSTTWSSLRWYAEKRAALYTAWHSGPWTLEEISAHAAQGHPAILLVHYRSLPGHESSSYQWDHFIVFQGIREDGLVSYDDPAFSDPSEGSNRTMTQAQLMDAWTSCVGGNPQQTATAFYNPSGPDLTPPDGEVTGPEPGASLTRRVASLKGWASDAESGFRRAHFLAYYSGTWRQIGPDFSTSPFALDWHVCNDWVPGGPLSLGLEIWDYAGNHALSPRGVRSLLKSYDCNAPPPAGRWEARYYQGSDCPEVGECTVVARCTEAIPGPGLHKEWGAGRPCLGVDAGEWVGDFTTSVDFPPGEYAFQLDHDGDVKLWVDGQPMDALAGDQSGTYCAGQGGYALDGTTELRVRLRRQDGEARLHLTWTDAASVCQAPAVAAFEASPLTGTAPLTVTYRNQSSGDYTNCVWVYGDGATAETCAQEHQYTYADPGTYEVSLTVSGPGGSDTPERSRWIAVYASEPSAALDAWPLSGEVPLRVSFANVSSGSFSACAWDYGDGHSSSSCETDHVYTYTVGGTYNVSLAVTGPGGSDKIIRTALIHAGGSSPPCEPDADSVAVYADAGYTGPCVVLGVGEYAAAAGLAPLSDNDAEALRAGINVQALLYEFEGFQGRSELVTGYRSDLQGGALRANILSSLKVQPVDSEKPNLTWSEPVSDTGIHRTVAGPLQLHVNAYDNLGIARVRFLRWDHPEQRFVVLGADEAAPYRVALDPSALLPGWNQVFAQALDLARNASDMQYIWVYRDLPRANLRPFALPGHPGPVVPTSMTGTYTTSTLHLAGPTYVDWHLTNDGEVDVAEPFLVELELDGARIAEQSLASLAPGTTGGTEDWAHTVSEPGWHKVRLIIDPNDRIAESDEEDNVWEGTFYWAPSVPYADDMENNPDSWAPSGLWHPVSAGSPHPASHSGDHSWWYGQDASGNYDVGQVLSGTLTLNPIYIPTAGYHLRFWYWYQTETAGPGWDQRWVLASIDGRSFSPIHQLHDDPQEVWLQSPAIDLSGYAGHVAQFRFAFDAVDELENDYRGWYIDDVTIANEPLPLCQDEHEPNDWAGLATPISYSQTIQGDICPGSDFDLYTFAGKAGDQVLIDVDAKSIGSLLDPYLFVLSHDGLTVLAENDDEVTEEVQDSLLQYRLPYDATYIIKVRAWDHPSVGSADHYYTLRLSYTGSDRADLDRRVYLPLAMRRP